MIITNGQIVDLVSRLKRPVDSHKGMFGKIGVVSSAEGMEGAVAMACEAAYRSGAGIVSVISLDEKIFTLRARMPMLIPEVMIKEFVDFNFAAIVVGSGFGKKRSTLLRRILKYSSGPIVLDADALNILSEEPDIMKFCARENIIITPHPAEMGRLLKVSVNDIQKDRVAAVKKAIEVYGFTVVLKGYKTLIAGPGTEIFENPTGNPALSKGGCGDVLSGMIAGFIGQGLHLLDAGMLGAYLHGQCADYLVNEKGVSELSVMPTELMSVISHCLSSLK